MAALPIKTVFGAPDDSLTNDVVALGGAIIPLKIASRPWYRKSPLIKANFSAGADAVVERAFAEILPFKKDRNDVYRVGGTRVTLDTVLLAHLDGASAEEIVERYPVLRLADVYAVLGYYGSHKEQLDQYLVNRRHQAAQIRQKIEQRYSSQGLRERLQARIAGR